MFIIVEKPMQEPRLHPECPVPKENADEYAQHIIFGQPSAESENQFDYTYFSRLRDYPECIHRTELPSRNVNDEELIAGKECNIRRIDQLQLAIETLKKDPTRRSIVMNTWIVGRDSLKFGKREKTSSPCLVTMHPQIVDNKLHLFVTMKTNDLYNAWPLNAYGFTALQEYMAKELNVDIGSYTHFSVSMQVYEDMYEMAQQLAGG
jgi:thymidylate synthase